LRHCCDSHILLIMALLAAAWIGAPPADACNVPVFRYALEQWKPDVYNVVVFDRKGIASEGFDLLQRAINRDSTVNFSLTLIDVSTEEGKAIADKNGVREFPWVQLFYPPGPQVREPAWEGRLNAIQAERLLESPARSALAEGLLAGDAAVWVLLACGDARKDKKALDALQKNLAKASRELEIPKTGVDINGNPIGVHGFENLRVHFGWHAVYRDDPDEAVLVRMLLGSESDLADYDEPVAFPVFGRGRALYALVGNGIDERNIFAACRSLVDWCSCEIKALHPGTDLLISADWSNPAGGRMVRIEELPPLTGFTGFLPARDERSGSRKDVERDAAAAKETALDTARAATVQSDSLRPEIVNPPGSRSNAVLFRNLTLVGCAALAGVLIASILIQSKKRKS